MDADSGGGSIDADNDGYDASVDCDDNDWRAYPGVAYMDSSSACMVDADYDGYGDAYPLTWGVQAGTDCDDDDIQSIPELMTTQMMGLIKTVTGLMRAQVVER